MDIKKTMIGALAFVTEHGNMSAENLELFTQDFCLPKSQGGAGQPREIVKLYDAEGNILARKCSGFKVWLPISDFYGKPEAASISKKADKLKMGWAREAAKMIKEGDEIRVEANGIEDPMEKLAKYEEYDAILTQANEVKTQDILVKLPDDYGVATIEEIAEELGVDVITSPPAKPEVEEDENTVDMSTE